jgi:ParB family chromosome partitioning protein
MYKALGKGLEALLSAGPQGGPASPGEIRTVEISQIKPNRYQPRTHFNDQKIQELADSIRLHGLAQPLLVTPGAVKDVYELVAGERRLKAAALAGMTSVPCIVRDLRDRQRFELSLIENIQREDLNPMEEARALLRLQEEFGLTQEEIASALGKSRPAISNTLRLLSLPAQIQRSIEAGLISEGHARSLASLDDPAAQKELAGRIVDEKLSVREIERIVSDWSSAISEGRVRRARRKDPDVRSVEENLQRTLGRQVLIQGKGRKGWMKMAFYSPQDLETLCRRLTTSLSAEPVAGAPVPPSQPDPSTA